MSARWAWRSRVVAVAPWKEYRRLRMGARVAMKESSRTSKGLRGAGGAATLSCSDALSADSTETLRSSTKRIRGESSSRHRLGSSTSGPALSIRVLRLCCSPSSSKRAIMASSCCCAVSATFCPALSIRVLRFLGSAFSKSALKLCCLCCWASARLRANSAGSKAEYGLVRLVACWKPSTGFGSSSRISCVMDHGLLSLHDPLSLVGSRHFRFRSLTRWE